ncbi:MAG TPA: hypothetical protein VMD29_02515 [Terracidiphilus sp.]|nr:hypothetical protein [Terracidiphilus sp.]
MNRLSPLTALGVPFAALLGLTAALALASPATSAAQDRSTFTPMPLDSGFGPMDTRPPSTPPDEIIKQFAAKESEFQDALNHYTYRRIAKVDTIDDDTHKVTGEWYEVDDVIFNPDGARMEKVVDAPPSTLENGGISMSPSDLQDIQHGYPFVLTTADLPKYNITYVGKQKVDEVDCYVFDVAPKTIEKHQRYLLGRVWVDSTDLQIVVTNGRMVPDDTRKGSEDLHPPFMTWRQQIDGHYWFPVYTKGEGILHFTSGNGYMGEDVHVRDVIKYSDYKRFGSTTKIIYDGQEVQNDSQKAPATTPPAPQKPQH